MKNNKSLIVQGELWSSHIFFKIFDNSNSKFISFYEPIMGLDPIANNKIFNFNEKSKNKFLWPVKIIFRTYKLIRVIIKIKSEVVITHHDDANISIFPTLFLFKYIFKRKIKFIAYIHNGNIYQQDNFLLKIIIPFMIKKIYKYFDKIITVSNGNKLMLETKFNLKNIEVIYNPIDLKKSSISSKKLLEKKYEKLFENNSFKFITVGRFTLQKNLFNLLKVFSKLKGFDAKLYIIGDGELKKELLNKINELELNDNVKIINFQSNIFNFIKNCDCFILNSYWESFGQVLVESLILNKIVISTDCKSGPREILCPELKLNNKIKYPYFGKFGILTKSYNLKENNISSNLVLENLLKNIISNKKKYSKKYSNTIIRAKDFDIENIQKNILEKLK